MYSGDTKTLKVTISPKSAKKKVSYSTTKKSVATVSKKGVITAKKAGAAKIKVTVTDKRNKKKTAYVNVKVKYVSLSLNKKSASIKAGQSLALRAKVAPKKKVKWHLKQQGSDGKFQRSCQGQEKGHCESDSPCWQ